jgi:hypothetical protein
MERLQKAVFMIMVKVSQKNHTEANINHQTTRKTDRLKRSKALIGRRSATTSKEEITTTQNNSENSHRILQKTQR